MAKKLYEYLHIDSSITTVGGFINQGTSPAKSFIGKEIEFLDVEDEGGVKNRDRIFYSYHDKDTLLQYSSATSIVASSPLRVGTILYIPKDQLFNEIYALTGKDLFMAQEKVSSFIDETLFNLLTNPLYVKSSTIKGKGHGYDVTMIQQFAQVWIYVKALDKIVNVTKFIKSLDTGVSSGGGAFSISLAPIDDPDLGALWQISNRDVITYNQIVSKGKFRTPYFSKYLQQNDVVFVRFEELDVESERRSAYDKLFIEKSQLPNQTYDMIGLIDDNSTSYSGITNDLNISITGRDFSKLLTEDGAYFLPFALMKNSSDFFINTTTDSKIFKRSFVSGDYVGLWFYTMRTIRDTLGFIFNQLTNTGVIPEGVDLFSSYEDSKKSKVYEIEGGDSAYMDAVEQNGVWQIIKLVIDKQMDDRRIANSDITRPDGTLMEQMHKVCQQPFVEFWGDTFGDTYSFIVRQPPFSKNQIIDYMREGLVIPVEGKDVDSFNFKWETEYYSWYQVEPMNAFLGKSDFISAAYVPVVFLEEYVDTFGNHKKVVPCNYISYQALKGDSGGSNTNLFRKAVAEDMKFLIESTAYLPFTRRGTISIKGGDRRIKRGTFIEFSPTGEVFYVDQVSNSLRVSQSDIDRVTTLTVTRGMCKDFIKGRSYFGKEMSYFNVVNTDYVKDEIINRVQGAESVTDQTKGTSIVDKEVFDFFLSRKQLDLQQME
jgi:hypothetical protein